MAYVISHFFPGGTKEQYEAAMIALNGELGVIPKGQILHVAGPVPGGWQVTAGQKFDTQARMFLAKRCLENRSRNRSRRADRRS